MGCYHSIPNDQIAIVTRCGKFDYASGAGLLCVPAPWSRVAGYLSNRVQEVIVSCETKTADNVFVEIQIAVQYEVLKDRVYEAFYRLENPQVQISAYVFDVVRATVPRLLLDEVFESKDEIAIDVKEQLLKTMCEFGFSILQALVTDISPDEKVRNAMNEINSSKRLRQAATEKAEAEKLVLVKKAEADSESMFLQGQGVARQRKAIMDGLKTSVDGFSQNIKGASPKDVLELVLISQYFDTLRGISSSKKCRPVFTNDVANGRVDEMRSAFMQGSAAKFS